MTNTKLIQINDFNKVKKFDEGFIQKIKDNLVHATGARNDLIKYDFVGTSHKVHLILISLNNIIHTTEFWKRTDENEFLVQLSCFILEWVRVISILLKPILPELMSNLSKFVGYDSEEIKMKNAYFRLTDKENIKHVYSDVESNIISNDAFNNAVLDRGYFNVNINYKEKIFIEKKKL